MKLEHIAFNVADPVAVAAWYCEHCGLRVVRHTPERAQTHFLADSDSTVLEIYCNPPNSVPDYRSLNPLIFHLALSSADPPADCRRLAAAGAVVVDEVRLEDGSHLIMMRDPWGLALQLCKRGTPLLGDPEQRPLLLWNLFDGKFACFCGELLPKGYETMNLRQKQTWAVCGTFLLALMLALPGFAKAAKAVKVPSTSGKITAVSADSITVKPKTGDEKTFKITAATKITLDGTTAAVTDLKKKESAKVSSADGTTADAIAAKMPKKKTVTTPVPVTPAAPAAPATP